MRSILNMFGQIVAVLVIIVMPVSASATEVTAGLVAHWPFDDGANPTEDVINNNDGQLTGTQYVIQDLGGSAADIAPILSNGDALDFDGIGDYVEVSDNDALTPSGDAVTIASWINPDTTAVTRRMICGKWNDFGREYQLHLVNGTVNFQVSNGLVTGSAYSDPVANGVWTHIAGVYDGSFLQVYVNGAPSGAPVPHTGAFANTVARFTIGAQVFQIAPNFDRHFDGRIDDCRIYDRALTTTEVVNLFEGPTAVDALANLINEVISLNLKEGISNSLDSKLDCAFGALDDMNDMNDAGAVGSLNAFINAVEAQKGHMISDLDADALITAVQVILDALLES